MRNKNLLVRCSELSKIMTKSRSKTSPLGDTTKSYVQQKAKEDFYGISPNFSNKYTEKGIMNEPLGIELINQTQFVDYKKNEERITNDWLTGECDINCSNKIIDIKCSWSFDTFPVFQEEAEKSVKKSGYDWQLRGYMLLYNKPKAEVVYCLTQTPPELLSSFDSIELHDVDHIKPEDRMTVVKIERDEIKESEMLSQYNLANEYYQECITELENKNKLILTEK